MKKHRGIDQTLKSTEITVEIVIFILHTPVTLIIIAMHIHIDYSNDTSSLLQSSLLMYYF